MDLEHGICKMHIGSIHIKYSHSEVIAVTSAVLFVVYGLRAIYRLYFHPLAKIPGPRIAALTTWYRFYREIKGEFPWKIRDFQEKYDLPPIIRVGPNHVVVHDPTQYDVIYKVNSKFLKDPGFYHAWTSGRNGGTTVTATDKRFHALRRRDTMGKLSKGKVGDLHPLIVEKISLFVDRVTDLIKERKPVDVFTGWRCMTLDIVSEFAFGQCLDSLHCPDFKHSMIDTMTQVGDFFYIFLRMPTFFVKLLTIPTLQKMTPGGASLHLFTSWARRCVVNYKPGANENSLFESLMDPNRPEKLTIDQLQSEAMDILVAGSDTTATTLTYACVNLARRRDLWEKLYTEIKPIWGPVDGFPPAKPLENVPLLTAVIKESLRLAAPVPAYLWRVVPEEGYTLNHGTKSYYVPANTVIGMSAAIQQSEPSLFPEPSIFKPERWLGANGGCAGPDGDLDRYFVPFSKGTRQCGGMNLAYLEIYLALGRMIMRFKIKGEGTPVEPMEQKDQFVGILQGHHWEIFYELRKE